MHNALILHLFKISCAYEFLGNQEFGDWVKAKSTTWYFDFLMIQYDNHHWIEHFWVSKKFVQRLTLKLSPLMEKRNIRFQIIMHVNICMAYSLYKLVHTA